MDTSAVSPIEVLNAAIQSHNPFKGAGIVKEQDVWGKGFPDVSNLNSHASNTVFRAIEQVRTSQSSPEKVTSIAITAQQGVGKTHILSRIRHKIERDGGALFIYAGVNNYTDLNLVKYTFQQTLADSLSHTGSQGVMQWQEVATAMANEGFKAINSDAPSLSPTDLIARFDKVCANWANKNKNLMNTLTRQVLRTKPSADPYIVRAILWTLSETQAPFAIKWLSGDDLAQSNADTLELPNSSKTSQEKENDAFKNIQQILNLVSYYNPVIICFDEIDVKNTSTNDGLPTELVIADLVKRLHDTLEHSEVGQGIVILTVMLPGTWTNKVNQMPGGTPDRVSKYTQRKPIDLKHINSDSMVDLVSLWLKEFYDSKNLNPPHLFYPFEESQLRDFGKGKPTVREALSWCAENFKVSMPPLPKAPVDRFELALTRELELGCGDYLENDSIIAGALEFGFKTLKGQTLEGVTLEDVVEVKPKTKNANWINFKIIGRENGKDIKIGVAVVQSSQVSLVAALRRLNEYETFDITRGCLVRSKDKLEQTKKNSEAHRLLNQLISEKGGEHVDLIEEQIKSIIAVFFVYQKRENYNLTEEQVFDIISQKRLTIENFLLGEILSDPSGQMPIVDDKESLELLEDILNTSSMDNIDDSNDLSDLYN